VLKIYGKSFDLSMDLLEQELNKLAATKAAESAAAEAEKQKESERKSKAEARANLASRVKASLKDRSTDAKKMAETAAWGTGTLEAVHEMLVAKENRRVDDGVATLRAGGVKLSDEKAEELRSNALSGIRTDFLDDVKTTYSKIGEQALFDAELFSTTRDSVDHMEASDHDAIAEALKVGGPEALAKFHSARSERLQTINNKDLFSEISELELKFDLPESKYKNLLKTGYELRSVQDEIRRINNEGQGYVQKLKESGLDLDTIKMDLKVQELHDQIKKLKILEEKNKALYLKQKADHAAEDAKDAPKNEEEFQSRIKDLGERYKLLNSKFGDQEFLTSVSKLGALMQDLRENNPEFQYWKNPTYIELARDSSGRNNSEMLAIENKTERDFADFAFDRIQKDPELVALFEKTAKGSNEYLSAIAGLEEERKGLKNLISPKRVGWLKDDASVTEKMWKLVVDNPSFHTIDAAREGASTSHRMVMGRFGLIRATDFEPTV